MSRSNSCRMNPHHASSQRDEGYSEETGKVTQSKEELKGSG